MRTEHAIEQEARERFGIDENNTVYDSFDGEDLKHFDNFEDAKKYHSQVIRDYVAEKMSEENDA
jgi:hypothetical protein